MRLWLLFHIKSSKSSKHPVFGAHMGIRQVAIPGPTCGVGRLAKAMFCRFSLGITCGVWRCEEDGNFLAVGARASPPTQRRGHLPGFMRKIYSVSCVLASHAAGSFYLEQIDRLNWETDVWCLIGGRCTCTICNWISHVKLKFSHWSIHVASMCFSSSFSVCCFSNSWVCMHVEMSLLVLVQTLYY